jgi:cold shock CspA family protein
MSSTDDNTTTQHERLIGQVKWFNNKAGYGFITVSDGEYSGKDFFAHYSTISVTNSQYKYLVQGEYVEFKLVKSSTDTHEFQATEITGIKNGPLMCETRRQNVQEETTDRPKSNYQRRYRVSEEDRGDSKPARRENTERRPQEDGEYTTVRSRRQRAPYRQRENTEPRKPREGSVLSTKVEETASATN